MLEKTSETLKRLRMQEDIGVIAGRVSFYDRTTAVVRLHIR